MTLDALSIVPLMLVACFFWHLLYRWLLSLGTTEYEGLLLTSVVQSLACVACFFVDLAAFGVPTTEVRDNKIIEEIYMISAAGFFLHDTPQWRPRPSLTSVTLLLHHILAFTFLMAALLFGKGGSIALQMSVIMEITTPLLAVRSKQRMTLDALSIVPLMLVACFFWHLLYRWLLSLGTTEYEGLLLTSVVQSLACVACFFVDLAAFGVPTTEVRDNKIIEEIYMISAAGFFLHDTPQWRPRPSLTSVTLLLHHILAFTFLMAALLFGKGGSIALQMSVIMEITTPLLAVRHYMRKNSVSTHFIQLVFALAFVILRFWVATDMVLWVMQAEEVPGPFKFGVFTIYLMSFGLLPGVLKMVLSPRPMIQSLAAQSQMVIRHRVITMMFSPPPTRKGNLRKVKRRRQ